MSTFDRGYIITGKVGAPYGIKGWLKIYSYTEVASHILQYNPWYLGESSSWQAFELEDGRQQGKGIVAKLVGIETPEEARKLTGRTIAILREQLAPLPENEYYWADLEGLMIIDQKGLYLGQISYLIATGSNDVLVIKNENGKEYAIPYLPGSVVKKIDLQQGKIYVDWDLI